MEEMPWAPKTYFLISYSTQFPSTIHERAMHPAAIRTWVMPAQGSTLVGCVPLFSADSEPQSGAKIRPQRGKPDHLFVMFVQCIFHAQVGADSGIDCAPATQIHACVPGGMRDAKPQKVRVRAPSYKASTQVCAPSPSHIIE